MLSLLALLFGWLSNTTRKSRRTFPMFGRLSWRDFVRSHPSYEILKSSMSKSLRTRPPKWWREIEFFTPDEFDSPDLSGSGCFMSERLVRVLDLARRRYGKPIRITSGVRTPDHNASPRVGGSPTSSHLVKMRHTEQDAMFSCNAVDVEVPDSLCRHILITTAIEKGISRIGIGKNFVHLDNDPSKAKGVVWVYENK